MDKITAILDNLEVELKGMGKLSPNIKSMCGAIVAELEKEKRRVEAEQEHDCEVLNNLFTDCLLGLPDSILDTKVSDLDGEINVIDKMYHSDDDELPKCYPLCISIKLNKNTDEVSKLIKQNIFSQIKLVNGSTRKDETNMSAMCSNTSLKNITGKLNHKPFRVMKKNEPAEVLFVSKQGTPLIVNCKIQKCLEKEGQQVCVKYD